jgi:hypothetical protein
MRARPPLPLVRLLALMVVVGVGGLAVRAHAAPEDLQVTPGEFIVEHPTLINLGFEWHIDGDANRNARVEVSFRKQGDTAWRPAMPLLRLHGEQVYWRNIFNLVVPNMFAGSILDLEPDTAYEARFALTDPDGVRGAATDATKVVTVRTRPEPMPASGGKVYHVYPTKWQGPKQEPAFEGLMCAYNYYCGAGDTAPGGRPRVKPGDTVLVHAGLYAYHYEFYANQTTVNATTTFEGTYYLTADGTAEQPIVIKAAGDGEVIIDGRGNFNLFNVKAADYNYFEGLTFRNTDIAIWAGTQAIAGAKGLTVKRCRFEDVGMGVFTSYSGSSDFYSSSDYNGFRPNGAESFQWNSPPAGVAKIAADDSGPAKVERRTFPTLEAYSQATKQDQHSVLVDYDIFTRVARLDAKDLATVQRLYKAEDIDVRLKPGSAAVDRGVELPNVTDGFAGRAPDLGAVESGQSLPTYGPRPR